MENDQDKPKRERLYDHVPEHFEIIEAQLQASTTRQRIEAARRKGLNEYEPEENMW